VDLDLTQLDLSRLQFATTTIYHFLFVPITIGLSWLVAGLHTWWHRSGNEDLPRRCVAAPDSVLRNAVADQHRDRGGDRARP
jgi:hypothetical protein